MPAQATDRRTQLLDAARELFLSRPYDEVTTTDVARQAGVAYGLIAHHFGNKRGLYLAAIEAVAQDLGTVRDAPPKGDTPLEQLRAGLTRHMAYMYKRREGFVALMNGGLGADPAVREIIERSRWEGAMLILGNLGIHEPVRPIVRAAMRAWVTYLDELILQDIEHHDVPRARLVDLAVAALRASLAAAAEGDARSGLDAELLAAMT